MTYEPKHRGEPKTVWRVYFMESERGRGQDYWETDYDTPQEAQAAYHNTNAKLTAPTAPDYYVKALKVEEVTL